MASVTVQFKKNKIFVRPKKEKWENRKYFVRFTDGSGHMYPFGCDTPDEVFNAAFELADNNDIGLELSRKIRKVWNRIE